MRLSCPPAFLFPALLLLAALLGAERGYGQVPPGTPPLLPSPPAGPQILTKAAEVARYVETDPELQPKVRLEAVATFVDPTGTVFLQDDSGATFLRSSKLGRTMRTGTRLSVTGERYPGLYIGGIVPDEVKVLGESPLPAPKAVTPDDLRTGRYHYQLVEITGVGRSLRMTGENTATLLLNTPDGVVEARFDQNPPEDTHDFVDAALRVTGLAAGAINDRRQLVQPYIRVADIRAITVLQPPQADPFAQPAVPMSTLLDGSTVTPAMHRMKVKGVALSGLVGGGFFVREDSRSLFIHTPYLEPLQPGDEVEALGFPQMGTFSAMLADAVFRVTGEGEPPSPVQATGEDLRNGTCDSDLIQIEARLLQKSGNENAWLAEVEGHSFKVMGGGHDLPEMEPGALVRFTGLCRVSGVRSEGYRTYPTGYELWLRSVADVQVLTAPPWWNAPRLALALATVAGAALLAATWAALLKRQVNRQLSILQEKTQAEAVLEERQRIAREFHDTLEQELAGLSIRLDAATPRVADEKARGLLEQQRRLLSRLQTETREFVWDLRDESRQVAPLPQSLGLLLDHLQSTTSIPLRLEVHGTPPSLPPLVQHHLLRIAREAVHNAIKYARPKTVQVEITAGGDTLELSIRDDGTGFDLEVAQVRQGHFGLQGMRERAKKLATELKVESLPGKGTRVGLTLALPRLRASLA